MFCNISHGLTTAFGLFWSKSSRHAQFHKKKVLLSKKHELFRDNTKKKVSLSKIKQDLILKKRTQSEERVLLNRKTGIGNAKKI